MRFSYIVPHFSLPLIASVFAVVLLVACSNGVPRQGGRSEDGVLRVVATTGMVADLVRAVGGERAEVHQIMGPGVDPHLYSPSRGDMAAIMDADMVFINGLMLEGRLGDALSGAPNVVRVAEGVSVAHLTDEEGEVDPHLWMDVALWAEAVNVVLGALVEATPEHGGEYAARAAEYREELLMLDRYIGEITGSVPEGRRVLVTAHDAFGYFGEAYGFEVIGIQGMSTESEAGLTEINRLVDRIVVDGIPAVFVESTISERNVRALVEGARSRDHEVRVGGMLYSDATGAGGTWEGTYIGMLDHNASTITGALGGSVPEGGFRGWMDMVSDAEWAGVDPEEAGL